MWKENSKGNYDLIEAIVYSWDGKWRGVWHKAPDGQPRILSQKSEDAARAMQLLEDAIRSGPESILWQEPTLAWRDTEEGHYCPLADGAAAFVKQATASKWYVYLTGGATLGRNGRPYWFSTANEAKRAALRLLTERSESGLEWVSHQR